MRCPRVSRFDSGPRHFRLGSPRWSSRSCRPSSRRGSFAAARSRRRSSSSSRSSGSTRLDPTLNAFVTVCADEALAAAASVDSTSGDAPFRGVPIGVKDLTATAGIRTTYSSQAYAEYVPDFDTAVVRRIREAGFVIVGKTNTPEFGTVAFTESDLNGVTRNPWNTDLTPGGSSGGAAAAVSAGLVPLAHATDGGGSIRIPASCCGLFGLKPSRGRVSNAPFGALEGLSTAGPMARTVEDAAAFLDVLSGYEPGDPWWAPPPERPFAVTTREAPGRAPGGRHHHAADRHSGGSRVRPRHDGRRRDPRRARPRRAGGDAAVARAEPLRPVPHGLAGRPGPPSGRRDGDDGAQSRSRRVGSGDLRRRVRTGGRPAAGARPAHRLLLGRRGRRPHADARPPAGPDRLAGSGGRARSNSSCATPSSRPSPRSRTSRGSPRCPSRSTGATTGSRSACRRSALPPETRSCSSSQRRSRRRGRGRTVVRRTSSSPQSAIAMRISWPGEACSMRAALPRVIASDMFL